MDTAEYAVTEMKEYSDFFFLCVKGTVWDK